MADISLTASMRSNLLSLQNTQSLMDMTQERLSTGKKVNSALDNPTSYYTSQSLTNRANDLSALLDSMGQGVQTIKAANEGIESITAYVQQAKAIANGARDEANKVATSSGKITAVDANADFDFKIGDKTLKVALETTDDDAEKVAAKMQAAIDADNGDDGVAGKFTVEATEDGEVVVQSVDGEFANVSFDAAGIKLSGNVGNDNRLKAVTQFNDILDQIDQLAKDSGYKGVNLLQENDLTVVFNEDRSSNLVIKGVDASTKGLKLSRVDSWGDNAKIDDAIAQVETAVNTLRGMASEFGNNYSIVQNREDFTESLINVLEEGSDKLVLADMNEESANMLALQTRQQLAINSLSLASQAAQSVLKLF